MLFNLQQSCYSKIEEPDALLFNNGVYYLKTRRFEEAIPEDLFFTWIFSFDYHQDFQLTPIQVNWLSHLTNADQRKPETQNRFPLIRLLFAQALGLAPHLNVVFFISGEPGSGKSTLYNLFGELLGKNQVTGTSVNYLDKWSPAMTLTKRVLCFVDVQMNSWRNPLFMQTLKTYSGRDLLTGQIKHSMEPVVGSFKGAVLVVSNFRVYIYIGDNCISTPFPKNFVFFPNF